jgi:hypothetical protein
MTVQSRNALLEAASHRIVAQAQTSYRFYSIAETGHILDLVVVNCTNEESAKQVAATKFRDDPQCRIIEVWEIGRRIARLSAPARWH